MRERAPDLRGAAPALLPLEVRGVVLEIGGNRLIGGIDLTLGSDGITVLMGPNGAGKSVLLRMLHGLIAPTGGEILWGGHPLTTEVRRRQALVLQKPVLLRRSVAGNLDFVLRRGDVARRRDALLDHVGLAGHAGRAARLLSGGEQQRLALARALATDPDVLLLDEPTASLDPASTLMIEEIVLGAAASGTRIVFITHDLGQARRLADDVVFIAGGRLAEHSGAATFFDHPASGPARAYLAGGLVT
jgi:tungstate transport system ATP-binding protein